MIIDFPIDEKAYAEYCPSCHASNVATMSKKDGHNLFTCGACGAQNDRQIIIDPKLHWWVDERKQYCHESTGILLVDPSRKILFYELTKFPYGFTLPAGHVDNGETTLSAAIREAKEEVNIDLVAPELIVETTIHGDKCRRGSDDHKWSLYLGKITQGAASSVNVDEHEGQRPRWVGISEIESLQMPYAMSFLFDNYKETISEALASK